MGDPLATYLHDHLAGSVHAVSLLEFIRDQHEREPLGRFASGLLAEIEADRHVLQELADRAGAGSSDLKEFAAWLSEKVTRLKLRHGGDGLGTFEALEFLELGIHGKWALWRALATVAATDTCCAAWITRNLRLAQKPSGRRSKSGDWKSPALCCPGARIDSTSMKRHFWLRSGC